MSDRIHEAADDIAVGLRLMLVWCRAPHDQVRAAYLDEAQTLLARGLEAALRELGRVGT